MKHSTKKVSEDKDNTKAKPISNYVSWFEIPALNFERAMEFYSEIYDIEMEMARLNDYLMAYFPTTEGVGGAIVAGEGCLPSDKGSLVYLNGGDDLSVVLNRVERAGGRIIMNKTLINEASGYFALFIDTEGNKMALHSEH